MKGVVTGAGGFIGAYLARHLVQLGWDVVALDNLQRGRAERLAAVADDLQFVQADVRDADAVTEASRGADVIFHLAAINGTENFYTRPELVLDVGLRGALAVVEAAQRADVPDLVVASSAEVYQTPPSVPTGEDVPLMLPDSLNPRYSYGGSKIVSELIAFNYGREHFRKVQAFRPHNVYGPDMGYKHVVPQFVLRTAELARQHPQGALPFQIQGDGRQTRAFCYVDDIVEGIVLMHARGAHRSVYHIGNPDMVDIGDLARRVAACQGREIDLQNEPADDGGTLVRCPDIGKMRVLGFSPKVGLDDGLQRTTGWYLANADAPSDNALL